MNYLILYSSNIRRRVRTPISTCQYSNYSIQITSEIQDVTLATQEGQPTKSTHQNQRSTITIQTSKPNNLSRGLLLHTTTPGGKSLHLNKTTTPHLINHQKGSPSSTTRRTKHTSKDYTGGPHRGTTTILSSVIVLQFVSYLV